MNILNRNTKANYAVLFGLILISIGFLFSQKTFAVSLPNPQSIPNYPATVINWDKACWVGLGSVNPPNNFNNISRNQINYCMNNIGAYGNTSWISSANNASETSISAVNTTGSETVNLQFNSLIFLTYPLTQNQTQIVANPSQPSQVQPSDSNNPPYSGNDSRFIPSLDGINEYINTPASVSGPGNPTISGLSSSYPMLLSSISKNNSSRYWFNNPTPFNLNVSGLTPGKTYNYTISFTYSIEYEYHQTPIYYCGVEQLSGFGYNPSCPTYTSSYEIQIYVPSQQINQTWDTVSGQVYDISTGNGLANDQITTCTANPTPPYDPGGNGMVSMALNKNNNGYWLAASDGGVFTFSPASFYGSKGGQNLNSPIVDMVATPDGGGYWLVGADGGVYPFGDAGYYGSIPGDKISVNNIVGMASTPDGGGYWLVGADGGVFAFGDAGYYNSIPGLQSQNIIGKLNAPIVGMASTPYGGGYWLVGADGGVFAFGDAGYYGSMGGQYLSQPIVSMASTIDGRGYWLVGADGGVFAFGDAGYYNSIPGLGDSITGITTIRPTADDKGYYLLAQNGQVYGFGDAFNVTTDSNGNFSFNVAQGNSYCVRAATPAGYTNNPALYDSYNCSGPGQTAVSYEWQVAGETSTAEPCQNSGSINTSNPGYYDIGFDNNKNFGFYKQTSFNNLTCNAANITLSTPSALVNEQFYENITFKQLNPAINNPQFSVQIGNTNYSSGQSSIAGNNLITSNSIGPFSFTTLGNQTAKITISGSNLSSPCVFLTNIAIGNPSYFKVRAGDIVAGSTFSTNPECSNGASIYANNVENPSSNFYTGSGSNMSALATNNIIGFLTGDQSTELSPNGLTFANNLAPTLGHLVTVPCAHKYIVDSNLTALPVPGANIGNTTLNTECHAYQISNSTTKCMLYFRGNLTLGNTQPLTIMNNTTIYVLGDVDIHQNIDYPNISNSTTLPSFNLIVQGNIYIENQVNEMNGLYESYPSSSSTSSKSGIIYTCLGINQTLNSSINSGYYSNCNNQLVVYGSVIAQQIDLMRTYGSLNQSSNSSDCANPINTSHAAELFCYSPLQWIDGITEPTNGQLNAAQVAPPIL